jgi:hypothetical protein
MGFVGELRDLPAHKVVECVTASALNAAIRAQVGAGDTDVERERLRVAEGAPANAGTDMQHAQAGLLKLYKMRTTIVNDFASIKTAVDAGKSVLIRGEYCSLPAPYRFQTSCAFSHCILVIPSNVPGNGRIIDPLDARGADGRPIGKDVPWAFIKTYCDSDRDNALIVQGPPAATPPPPPPPPTPVGVTMIATRGGLQTGAVMPKTPYTHEVGGATVGTTPPVATRYLIRAYSTDGKFVALDGLYAGPVTGVYTPCGWVPTSAVTLLQDAIPPAVKPTVQRTVTSVTVALSDGTTVAAKP